MPWAVANCGWATLNLLGYIFVMFQAVVVLVFVELEWIGLKRSTVVTKALG